MAFNPNNLIRWAPIVASDANTLFDSPLPIAPPVNLPQFWAYNAGNDTIANVESAGYFYYFANYKDGPLYQNGNFFQAGDQIYCVCLNGTVTLTFTSIIAPITTQAFSIPPGSIVNSDIANGAINQRTVSAGSITTTEIAANAGILSSQLASNNNINGLQLSATANIVGSQLAPGANILGSQLNPGANIVGTQLTNNTITSQQLDLSTIQFASLGKTLGAFQGMYASPQLVIAGVPNKAIIVESMVLVWIAGSAPLANGGNVALQYGNSAMLAGVECTGIITAAELIGATQSSAMYVLGGFAMTLVSGLQNNVGIYISNDGGAFTGGTGGSAELFIWYRTIELI